MCVSDALEEGGGTFIDLLHIFAVLILVNTRLIEGKATSTFLLWKEGKGWEVILGSWVNDLYSPPAKPF